MDRTRALFARRRLEWLIFRFVSRGFKVKEDIDLDIIKGAQKYVK